MENERERISLRSGSSPQSKATRRWRIMKNENVKMKNEKKKKKETFYSGVSGFMTNLSGPVHAFKYVMNIKMRYITAPFSYYSDTRE